MAKQVVVRLTEEQYKLLAEAAKKSGRKITDYIRHIATKAARLGWGA